MKLDMRKIGLRSLIISLVLALTLVSGCTFLSDIGVATPPSPTATGTAAPPMTSGWTAPVEGQSPTLPGIADVVAKVKPSVVAINVKSTGYDIFNRPSTQEGAGSGWIIDKNGIIVTNNHVVEGADDISVVLDDGRTFAVDIKTVATDPVTDLAVLKINATNLPAVTVGDASTLRIGDWVVAIGNALGRGIRATQGIVSSKGVSIQVDQEETLYNLIETTAAINPGNSGGPLVNMAGQVIGITSIKISAAGVEGMGYAISSQEATPILQQLVNTGYVVRPYLGVGMQTVDQFAVIRYGLAVDKGVLITSVGAGSPADKAGIKEGDVITKFQNQDINDIDALRRAIHSSQVGQTVDITFWRGKTQSTVKATLTESPPPSR